MPTLGSSDKQPLVIQMSNKRADMVMNLLLFGATLLLIVVIAWPYISQQGSTISPESVGKISFDMIQGCDEAKVSFSGFV